jgi:hypothetical protein
MKILEENIIRSNETIYDHYDPLKHFLNFLDDIGIDPKAPALLAGAFFEKEENIKTAADSKRIGGFHI